MKLLLATQVLLWWLSDDSRLMRAADVIADPANDILVGVPSLWEIVVKVRIGKLEANIEAIELAIVRDGFQRLAISNAHLIALATLSTHHRDPFDHLLIAQAIVEDATLVSDDDVMPAYPVRVLTCRPELADNPDATPEKVRAPTLR